MSSLGSPDGAAGRRRDGGFTLVEVLWVVVIIGLLAALAVQAYDRQRTLAYLAAVKSDVRNLAEVQVQYFHEHDVYGTAEQLAAFGDRLAVSPGNRVEVISGGSYENGFCLMALHEPTRLVWFWDSEAGGLMAAGESCIPCQGGGGGGGAGSDYCPGSNGDGHYRDCPSGGECTNPPRAGQSGGALDPTQDPQNGSNGGRR